MPDFLSEDPKHLKDLHCGCGKPAEVVWMNHPPKEGPKKLSKTETVEAPKSKEPSPVGWSCKSHIPPGVP